MIEAQTRTLKAAADYGISLIVFRNTLAKGLGLNLTESLCMTILGVRAEVAPTLLANLVGLTTGAMTTMLDRLEAKGFVRRRPNPRDRRGILIAATEHYQEAALKLVSAVQRDHRALLETYTEEQLAFIADFLSRFTENLARNSPDVRELRPMPDLTDTQALTPKS
jgi:DNA-binding MarR family transcriptional regulator